PRDADAGRRLDQLPTAEEPERLERLAQIRAERVELVVAARDEVLHHRLPRLGLCVRLLDLARRVADDRLEAVLLPEADGLGRLEQDRVADFLRGRDRLRRSRRIARVRDVARRLELHALALDALEVARERTEQPELVAV